MRQIWRWVKRLICGWECRKLNGQWVLIMWRPLSSRERREAQALVEWHARYGWLDEREMAERTDRAFQTVRVGRLTFAEDAARLRPQQEVDGWRPGRKTR